MNDQTVSPVRTPRRWVWLIGSVLLLACAGWGVRTWVWSQAEQALQSRLPDVALSWLRVAETMGTARSTLALARCRAFRQQGEFAKAERELQAAKASGGSTSEVRLQELLLLAETGQLAPVESQLPKLLQSPDLRVGDVCAAFVRGFILNARTADALGLIKPWQADDPSDAESYYLHGVIFEQAQDFRTAADSFRTALKLAPRRIEIRLALAESLLEFQELDAAYQLLQTMPSGKADRERALLTLARVERRRGRFDEARRALEQLPAEGSAAAAICEERGRLELDAAHEAEAVEFLQRSVELNPRRLSARQALGQALLATRQIEAARPHLEFASQAAADMTRIRRLEDQPEIEPQANLIIAQLYARYGNDELSAARLRLYQRSHPDDPEGRLLAKELESRRRDNSP